MTMFSTLWSSPPTEPAQAILRGLAPVSWRRELTCRLECRDFDVANIVYKLNIMCKGVLEQ